MTQRSTAARPGPLWILTATGQDRPGITSGLLERLSQEPSLQLVDLGQAVTQGALSLSFVLRGSLKAALKRELVGFGRKKKLEIRVLKFPSLHSVSSAAPARGRLYAVTLIAPCLDAACLAPVTETIAQAGANIEAIRRLSAEDLSCLELLVRFAPPAGAARKKQLDPAALRQQLLGLAAELGIDVGWQEEGLYRRSKRLVVFDMDSTLIQNEVIDELARERGVHAEVAAITEAAMAGRWDYDQSLVERVKKLKGLTRAQLDTVYQRITLTPGAEELVRVLKRLGYRVAVISGGFRFFAERLKERLGLDYAFANDLMMDGDRVAGRVTAPIVNARRKADLLETLAQQEGIELEQVIAVGDGANDLLMLERAGLGIAFNAKPVVQSRAKFALNQRNLRTALYLLGLTESDIRQALS